MISRRTILRAVCAAPLAACVRAVEPRGAMDASGPVNLLERYPVTINPIFAVEPGGSDIRIVPATVISRFFWLEIDFTPTQATPPTGELLWADPAAGTGALRLYFSPATGEVQVWVGPGPGQPTVARIDLRKAWQLDQRTHLVITGGDTASGTYEIQAAVNGAAQIPDELTAGQPHPGDISALVVGKMISGSAFTGLTINRVAGGWKRLTPDEMRGLADAANMGQGMRVVCVGDSLTDSADDYHAALMSALGSGPNRASVANWGFSGHTCIQALARLDAALATRPTHVVWLCGINNIARDGNTAAATFPVILEARDRILAAGAIPIFLTLLPFKNNTASGMGWTSGKQTQLEAFNASLLDLHGVDGVRVVDAYAHFNAAPIGLDDMSFGGYPTATSPLLVNRWTYDGIHPRGAWSVAPGDGGNNGADELGALIWRDGFSSYVFA